MRIVTPGEVITSEAGFLRGHGTYFDAAVGEADETRLEDDRDDDEAGGSERKRPRLVACTAGVVERVNKLVSARAPKGRYVGQVGDLVVGRVAEVRNKRWTVEVGGAHRAHLALASVDLPGGEQRLRTYEDQLQMRSFYAETDLISAEVQAVGQDGLLQLHTRALK